MENKISKKIKILRRTQVQNRTALARSTMYKYIDDGTFPRPIQLGPRTVGWVESEVDSWLAERVTARDKGYRSL